jgi:hypothetical protein
MLRADFFSTAYHPPRSLPASWMSFEGSRHSVPLGSPMTRAPPLAVSLFLPPVLSKHLALPPFVPGTLGRQLANRFPARNTLVACALKPPAECKGKCYTETNQSTEIRREREFFP